MKFNAKKFGEKVYMKACAQRLTVRQAGDIIGISTATFSRIQNGKPPDIETFGKACKWLNMPMESFFKP